MPEPNISQLLIPAAAGALAGGIVNFLLRRYEQRKDQFRAEQIACRAYLNALAPVVAAGKIWEITTSSYGAVFRSALEKYNLEHATKLSLTQFIIVMIRSNNNIINMIPEDNERIEKLFPELVRFIEQSGYVMSEALLLKIPYGVLDQYFYFSDYIKRINSFIKLLGTVKLDMTKIPNATFVQFFEDCNSCLTSSKTLFYAVCDAGRIPKKDADKIVAYHQSRYSKIYHSSFDMEKIINAHIRTEN